MPEGEYEVYEPWVPRAGQEVRVLRPSTECICEECGRPGHRMHPDRDSEWPKIGTVTKVMPTSFRALVLGCLHMGSLGHRFYIKVTDEPRSQGYSAAIELEPLEIPN